MSWFAPHWDPYGIQKPIRRTETKPMTPPEYLAKLEALPECEWIMKHRRFSESFSAKDGTCGDCPPCRSRLAAFPVLLKTVRSMQALVEAWQAQVTPTIQCSTGETSRWIRDRAALAEQMELMMSSHIPPDAAERGRG